MYVVNCHEKTITFTICFPLNSLCQSSPIFQTFLLQGYSKTQLNKYASKLWRHAISLIFGLCMCGVSLWLQNAILGNERKTGLQNRVLKFILMFSSKKAWTYGTQNIGCVLCLYIFHVFEQSEQSNPFFFQVRNCSHCYTYVFMVSNKKGYFKILATRWALSCKGIWTVWLKSCNMQPKFR